MSCSCRNLNSFSPAMVWEAPVSAHTAIFSPKILRTIKLEGSEFEFKLNNVIQFTAVSVSLALLQVGHLDLMTPGVPHPYHWMGFLPSVLELGNLGTVLEGPAEWLS
ncbi:hypothetical protein NPIL_224311 [Nephila pilipes]|uniref:Uncharacterized protein n=1 Tax=Nephila pilipes TaxID=299642 RepID=A0A8X6P651_NEPPI|nr:hypothetical protein NPIL_389111 [Nephila pilipes]GFT49419.1 hypothetical protein NPIL_224311 [Nephila pilipes]